MKAMLLAAGLGTRLHPITRWLPKPMLPVFGSPIIEHNLLQLSRQGIREVIVNLHHLPRQIIQHCKDGDLWGLRINYSLEPILLGTAGGIKNAADRLGNETFLVMNADTFRIWDLNALLDQHRKRKSMLTLLLKENPKLNRDRAVWVDKKGNIVRFLDLYQRETRSSISADFLGIQVMEPEVLGHIPPNQPWEIQQVYLRLLSSGLSVGGHLQDGYWRDLGSLSGYWGIHVDALDGRSPLAVPGRLQRENVWVAEGAVVESGSRVIPPIFIGPESRVSNSAQVGPYAVVGAGCAVEDGAQVARSILWDGVRVPGGAAVDELLWSRHFKHPLQTLSA